MNKKIVIIILFLAMIPFVLNAGSEKELFMKGRALANKGDYDLALEAFSEATLINPDYTVVYLAMAVVYVNMKRNYEAIDSLSRVLSLDANNANAYYILGMVYEEVGNGLEAIDAWKRYLEIKPRGGRSAVAREHLKRLEHK